MAVGSLSCGKGWAESTETQIKGRVVLQSCCGFCQGPAENHWMVVYGGIEITSLGDNGWYWCRTTTIMWTSQPGSSALSKPQRATENHTLVDDPDVFASDRKICKFLISWTNKQIPHLQWILFSSRIPAIGLSVNSCYLWIFHLSCCCWTVQQRTKCGFVESSDYIRFDTVPLATWPPFSFALNGSSSWHAGLGIRSHARFLCKELTDLSPVAWSPCKSKWWEYKYSYFQSHDRKINHVTVYNY